MGPPPSAAKHTKWRRRGRLVALGFCYGITLALNTYFLATSALCFIQPKWLRRVGIDRQERTWLIIFLALDFATCAVLGTVGVLKGRNNLIALESTLLLVFVAAALSTAAMAYIIPQLVSITAAIMLPLIGMVLAYLRKKDRDGRGGAAQMQEPEDRPQRAFEDVAGTAPVVYIGSEDVQAPTGMERGPGHYRGEEPLRDGETMYHHPPGPDQQHGYYGAGAGEGPASGEHYQYASPPLHPSHHTPHLPHHQGPAFYGDPQAPST